jgi:choline dehydrogenase-like flavoprotein
MDSIKTQVLVVGGGPTGMILAWDLALLGVDVTIFDRLPSIREYSREVGIPASMKRSPSGRRICCKTRISGNCRCHCRMTGGRPGDPMPWELPISRWWRF